MTSMCRNLNWNRIVSPVVAINALIYGDTVIYADVTAGQPIAKPFVSGAARRGAAWRQQMVLTCQQSAVELE